MTAKKPPRVIRRGPRIQVTLTPEGMAMLERLAKATGEPKATLLGELIEQAMPSLEAMVQAIEMVREQPREAQRLLANFGANVVGELTQSQLDLDAHITSVIDRRTVKGRRLKGRARGPT